MRKQTFKRKGTIKMRKLNFILLSSIAVLFVMLAVSPASAKSSYGKDYAENRAQIEDLQARYMFAFDFKDFDLFASLFTEDGIFVANGEKSTLRGRDEIRKSLMGRYEAEKARQANDPLYETHPPRSHYSVSNLVIKINGNKATGRSYWSAADNANEKKSAVYKSYGHYEDEYERVNGEWKFSYRKVVYENRDGLFHVGGNPAW